MFKDSSFYKLQEVADAFRVKGYTVREWEKKGWIESFNPPGSKTILYSGEELNRFYDAWKGNKLGAKKEGIAR